MLRFLDAGESHGPCLTAVVEGLPAGIPVTVEYINKQLERRQTGYGRGGRMQIEKDSVRFLSGVRGGLTLGSPVSMIIANRDWPNWRETMGAGPEDAGQGHPVTHPRPGHADLAGALKYAHRDIRNVLERSSARETAMRTACGTLARRFLEELNIHIYGRVTAIGKIADTSNPPVENWPGLLDQSVMCTDKNAARAMMEEIGQAGKDGDSLGGLLEVAVKNLPPGLGSYVHWDRRLDGLLAGALMSIQAIKGVEIGNGFACARERGSLVHDAIHYCDEAGFYRNTNRAGGLEGGMTNGETLILRAAMKPIPTLGRPLASVDIISRESVRACVERSDVCAVPAALVVAEAVTAWVIASACLEKFGGDTLEDVQGAWDHYLARLS